MKSDKSRETFDATKHFSSVRLQQGRVLTDADWNEQSDVIEHRDETTSLDVIGPAGVPEGANGFMIGDGGFVNGIADLTISQGRIYLDGILCEQEDPALKYSSQPDPFFNPDLQTVPTIPSGLVLAYLDVWQRHIGVVEDPFIREVALGGPDTATRAKTVWQVKTVAVDTANGGTVSSALANLQVPVDEQGKLAARAQPSDNPTDPCIIPQAAGFRSLENQLYRVEVHTPGQLVPNPDSSNGLSPAPGESAPTFKWSRDNGSVVAAWIDDPHPLPNTVKVQLLINDATRAFAKGNWVELSDDARDLSGFGGIFVQLTNVDGDTLTYDPTRIIEAHGLSIAPPIVRPPDDRHPKVRRWDMPDNSGGPQAIIRQSSPDPGGSWIDLELGVQVQFQAGRYRTGDYWMIPARTATNSIQWPPISASSSDPARLPPAGIQHHFTCLASFTLTSSGFQGGFADCRKVFSPLTELNPVKPIDQPQPDEYRYYLVDGGRGTGNDALGVVGIDRIAGTAYTKAVPFATVSAAIKSFPRDGNGSVAVIMVTPLGPEQAFYDNLILQGVHGYRKILIRCSDFVDVTRGLKSDPLDDSDWVVCGASPFGGGPFSLDGQNPSSVNGNAINVSTATPLNANTDELVGLRLRFVSSSIALASMVLGNARSAAGGERLTIGDTFAAGIPGGMDQFLLEQPAASFNFIELGVTGTEQQAIGQGGVIGGSPNISIVGLSIGALRLSGPVSGEVAFCSVTDLGLGRFGNIKITPDYTDEFASTASFREVGVGANVSATLHATDGDGIEIANSVGFGARFMDVDNVSIPSGFFSQTTNIVDCARFSIGAEASDPVQSPRLIRLGSNLAVGAALSIQDSDGDVLGTAFDISNIHNEGRTVFDFNPDDSVDLAAIHFEGTGRSLRIRDVNLTVASTQNTGFSASGVLLDATDAVSSIFDYTQRRSGLVSGLIALPGRTIFRPFELSFTDVRDAADNHYLSPSVSSADVATQAFTLGVAQGRSFIQKGIPVQGITTAGPQATPGIARYRVVQFVGDGTSRVRVARIDLKDFVTKAPTTPAQIAASIAGVMQQTIQPAEDSKAFGICVPSGYTLIALDPNGLGASLVLPAPLYCSTQWGMATVSPQTTDDNLAVVRIGVLVRIVVSGGLGDTGSGDSWIGLARFQVDPNAVAGATPSFSSGTITAGGLVVNRTG